ncbi:MAG: molybdenum cofactor biosynthesis protein MoaE [Saccharospirillaceae bacterium]|nr:molybdenum cofactor biosynthesis protein MoaE [Pseudomonadales bacterium]NRB78768.1 molybdenum cofactor biosynthesis protein MoaE [Saccharospirillaceae bacterium]
MNKAYSIKISTEDFNVGLLQQSLHNANLGAIVTFTGTVRDLIADDGLAENTQALIIDHYPVMCQKVLGDLCEQALTRWDIGAILINHRVGKLERGEQIVFVGVSSKHRKEAFFACDFLMDFLKTKAPFWKQETKNNQTFWVDAKDSDQQQLEKWER